MIHIVLCCASGMSTSLIVEKMKRAAMEQNIEVDINAAGSQNLKEVIQNADVILLGPQMRYAMKKIEEEVPNVPIAHVAMKDYGMMNGRAILKQALELLEKES